MRREGKPRIEMHSCEHATDTLCRSDTVALANESDVSAIASYVQQILYQSYRVRLDPLEKRKPNTNEAAFALSLGLRMPICARSGSLYGTLVAHLSVCLCMFCVSVT